MTSSVKQVTEGNFSTLKNTLLQANHLSKPIASSRNKSKAIIVSRQNIHSAIEVFQWRYKTSLPIIKPVQCFINPNFAGRDKFQQSESSQHLIENEKNLYQGEVETVNMIKFVKSHPHLQFFELLIRIEDIKYRLSDLKLLHFSQIIYLLRQMMIGYDVLVDIFGTFNPKDTMMVVNGNDQWRIWINEETTTFTKNADDFQIGEKEFIYRLILIAQKHCTINTLSKIFFSSMKQFVNSKQCTFITTFQKIKAFASFNKIYGSNKVNLPNERLKGSQFIKKHEKNMNFLQANKRHKNNSMNNSHVFQRKRLLKTQIASNKMSIIFNKPINESEHYYIDQSRKQNEFVTTTKEKLQLINKLQAQKMKGLNLFTNSPKNCGSLSYFSRLSKPNLKASKEKRKINTYKQIKKLLQEQNKANYGLRKSIKLPSLQKILPPHQSNSRNYIKRLMSSTIAFPQQNTKEPILRREARKYSHEMFTVKSFYKNIAQWKINSGFKISKKDRLLNLIGIKPLKRSIKNSNIVVDNKIVKSSIKFGHLSELKQISSNNSLSTKALQNSGDTQDKNKKANYKYLKINDLNSNKLRNNQSSYHNTGVRKSNRQRKDKNLTVSFEFRNKNQFQSRSVSSKQHSQNNWTKKLSGLFSDNSSIKHLKGSVRLKSKEEQLYEKEYLKDVRLQLLQKFGRSVRHSIVDEQGEYSQQENYLSRTDQLKSMQLIEEVIDDDKSLKMKEECLDEQRSSRMKDENQTIYIVNIKSPSESELFKHLSKKQCLSEHDSLEISENKMNLQICENDMENIMALEFIV